MMGLCVEHPPRMISHECFYLFSYPKHSMSGIFTYIYLSRMTIHVGKHTSPIERDLAQEMAELQSRMRDTGSSGRTGSDEWKLSKFWQNR